MKISRKKDVILGLLCILFAAFIIWSVRGLPGTEYEGDPGPAVLPVIGSVLMAFFGIILVVRPGEDGATLMTAAQWKAGAKLFGVYILMAVLLWLLGFMLTVPIILFAATFLLSKLSAKEASVKQRLIRSAVFACAAGAVIYVVYIMALGASLPKGLIWSVFS